MVAIAILTGALEGFNLAPGFIDEAIAFGVFLFYTYLITVHEAETRASLITKDLALSQSELKLLRQQIRPHFGQDAQQKMPGAAAAGTDPDGKQVAVLCKVSKYPP